MHGLAVPVKLSAWGWLGRLVASHQHGDSGDRSSGKAIRAATRRDLGIAVPAGARMGKAYTCPLRVRRFLRDVGPRYKCGSRLVAAHSVVMKKQGLSRDRVFNIEETAHHAMLSPCTRAQRSTTCVQPTWREPHAQLSRTPSSKLVPRTLLAISCGGRRCRRQNGCW